MSSDPKVAVVTGAGSGIGRAVSLRLAATQMRVALLGRRTPPLESLAVKIGDAARVYSVDVRDEAAVAVAFAKVASELGPLDALVANAGVSGENQPGVDDRWDEVVRTNLDGTYFCARAFERHVAEGPEPRHFVAISSCLARFPVPLHTAYSASKAGILGLVRGLALDWAERGIRVNAICPGWVDTDMARASMQAIANRTGTTYEEARRAELAQVPLGRIAEPEEIAGLVAFLLSTDGQVFTGQSLDPNGGSWMG